LQKGNNSKNAQRDELGSFPRACQVRNAAMLR